MIKSFHLQIKNFNLVLLLSIINITALGNTNLKNIQGNLVVNYHIDYIFGKDEIKWCTVPVPPSVYQQSQTHPSILYFPNGWNGYTHWLGTTPYPDSNNKYENPCIYYANPSTPDFPPNVFTGIPKNPIYPRPSNGGYNSDIELFLHHDTLYAFNRENYDRREIEVQSSLDGFNWSATKHVYSSNDVVGKEVLSPSIIHRNSKLYIYHLNGDAGNSYTGRCTSMEIMVGTSLSKPDFKFDKYGSFINQEESQIQAWHFDLFEYKNKLFMVFCGRKIDKQNPMYTYLAVSEDYVNFYIYEKPLINCFNTYRPTAYIDKDDNFILYFSVVGNYVGDGTVRAIGVAKIEMPKLLNYIINKTTTTQSLSKNKSINVFFNPVNKILTINNFPEIKTISIFHSDGREIKIETPHDDSIDCNSFSNGIYIVKTISKNGTRNVNKFIITH